MTAGDEPQNPDSCGRKVVRRSGFAALNTTQRLRATIQLMSGEVAAKVEPLATLHAVDRRGRTVDLAPARPLLDRVLSEWNPERIQLFGSRARGDADPDSDWDILVVVSEDSLVAADPLVPWRLRRDSGVRADVVVYSSREFEAERDVPNTLAYEAAWTGVALYER